VRNANTTVIAKRAKGIYRPAAASEGGDLTAAAEHAAQRWGSANPVSRMTRKAVGSGALIPSASWGDELGVFNGAQAEFFAPVMERTILGRLNVPRVPLRTRIIRSTAGTIAYWIAEGAGKGVTPLTLAASTLNPLKLACLTVITKERTAFEQRPSGRSFYPQLNDDLDIGSHRPSVH
jgi:hypothetical protein